MKLRKGLALILALGMLTGLIGCNKKVEDGSSSSDTSEEAYSTVTLEADVVKNVILFIGDGMGPEQIDFGAIMKESPLRFQEFPYMTQLNTDSVDGLTDSAAAATALATGTLTSNGRVGFAPDSEEPLTTIMDIAKGMGKSTGVITTETLNGATPMGFSSHATARGQTNTLLSGAAVSGIDFFASDLTSKINDFKTEGYSVINFLKDYEGVKDEDKVYCNFKIKPTVEEDDAMHTTLEDTVETALDFLSKDEDGFVLMAEGAHIDHGGHNNDIDYMVEELLAFDEGVQAALQWAKGRTDTVVIVTADHETGGLTLYDGITKDNYREMVGFDGFTYGTKYYSWSTTGHSQTYVNFYVNGKNIDFKAYSQYERSELMKNTATFYIMKDLLENKI